MRPQHEQVDTAIVTEFSKEFNIEDVYRDESVTVIASLPSLVESTHVELPANAPVGMEIPESKVCLISLFIFQAVLVYTRLAYFFLVNI